MSASDRAAAHVSCSSHLRHSRIDSRVFSRTNSVLNVDERGFDTERSEERLVIHVLVELRDCRARQHAVLVVHDRARRSLSRLACAVARRVSVVVMV